MSGRYPGGGRARIEQDGVPVLHAGDAVLEPVHLLHRPGITAEAAAVRRGGHAGDVRPVPGHRTAHGEGPREAGRERTRAIKKQTTNTDEDSSPAAIPNSQRGDSKTGSSSQRS